jgi:DNA-binding PadR family transcriptional regulator
VNFDHPNFGLSYRLGHLATTLRSFTASELHHLTGIKDDTIYGFLARLTQQGYLDSVELARSTRGRPIKRYTVTESGLDHLLRKNARIAAILNNESSELNDLRAAPVQTALQRELERAASAATQPRPASPARQEPARYASASDYEVMS